MLKDLVIVLCVIVVVVEEEGEISLCVMFFSAEGFLVNYLHPICHSNIIHLRRLVCSSSVNHFD